MSQSLPQFSGTTFPNANDSYLVFTDINESNKPFIDQYYSYLNQNDFQSATQVLTEHPDLQYVIINAKVMQKMYDMIMAVETFVSSTTFYEKIGGIVKDKGDYNATVQYELWNIVYYNGLAYMVTGNNGVKPPIGTLPSSTTYFKPVTIRGVSGTGLAFHTTWNSIDNYSISDCVPYGNRLYVCIQANANKIPSDFPDYWTNIITIPQETIWSKTQPVNQDDGNVWNEINDVDSSYISHIKQSDGTYITRYPISNANFILFQNGTTVEATASRKSSIISETLTATNWTGSSAPYTYTLAVSGVTTTNPNELLPSASITEDQLSALQAANIQDGGQSVGSLTLHAYGDKPTIDIPIRVIVRGDM